MFESLKRNIHERKHGKNFFLVYSMGKVGSSTVFDLLQAQYPFLPAVQLHFLSDHWLKEVLPKMNDAFSVNHKLADEYHALRAKYPEHRLKIITLVREPVGRDISDVFENWKAFFGIQKSSELTKEMVMERLRHHRFDYTLNWFDTEFKNWTGYDIYNLKFDRASGHTTWKLDGMDILCLKLEKLNEVCAVAFKEFCGFSLKPGRESNVGEQKALAELYKSVKADFRLDKVQEEIVFNSKYLEHFYTPEEIQSNRKRWCKS